jgi:DNA polymerase elongation subunit (family B)
MVISDNMPKGLLLNVYSENNDNESFIKIVLKTETGKEILEDHFFKPYFYIISNKELTLKDLENYPIIAIEPIKKDLLQIKKFANFKEQALNITELKKMIFYKIQFKKISDLLDTKTKIKDELFYEGKFEYDIPFEFRYVIDKNIFCLKHYDVSNNYKFKELKSFDLNLTKIAFDIETLGKSIDPKKEPIVLISLYSTNPKLKKVIGYKMPSNDIEYYTQVADEKNLLIEFLNIIKNYSPDIIYTYNGDNYDLNFIKERCKKQDLLEEFDKIFMPVNSRNSQIFELRLIQHIDVYKVVRSLSMKGSLDLFKLDLDTVYNYLFGKNKIDLPYKEIENHYNNPKLLEKFIEYNLVDSIACYEIGENFLQQFIALSQLTGKDLQEITRTTSSTIVESLIMHRAIQENKIIPNIPIGGTIDARNEKRFQGAYVKEPILGLHENLAIVDFQSLYPSVIITYNISPETINEKTENIFIDKDKNIFSQDIIATIPKMLKEVFDQRIKAKMEMKKYPKNSLEYKTLFAHQWSFKTILNSTYGYLGYARARWYNFDCGQSIANTSREHTLKVISEAENNNLKVIYGDTDSCFLQYQKDKKEIFDFLEKTNNALPGIMELSLDGFYKRGLFVQKKGSEEVAKKKYALIDEDNNMKIVGFEFVRHDWSKLAKETQKKILEYILKDNDIEKAKDFVKKIIENILNHKIENDEFIIYNQVRKDVDDYNSINPAVSALKKALKKGYVEGFLIGYIITNNGKSISDKAEIAEYVKQGDYDSNYYIENQIIPSVKNIFAVFNISEDQLMNKPSQKKLF